MNNYPHQNSLTEPLNSQTQSNSILPIPISLTSKCSSSSSSSSLSMLSKFFFSWTLPLITSSNNHSLNFSSVTSTSTYRNPSISQSSISESYQKLKSKYKGKQLFLTIISTFMPALLFVSFISLLLTILKLARIKILGKLIFLFKHINDNSNVSSNIKMVIYYNGIVIIIIKLIKVFINAHNRYYSQVLGVKVSAALSNMIYDKVLTSALFMRNDINKGELLNYIQVDVETLNFVFFYGPNTIVVPIQIIMNIVMLFQLFGFYFIYSFFALMLFILLAWIVQKMYIDNQRDVLTFKDQRTKAVISTLQNIKMVKMFTMENYFLNKINMKREFELNSMKKLQNIYVLSCLIHWAIPLVLSIVSIGVYSLLSKEDMSIENLIMAIEIFDSISYPLYRVPVFITNLLNTIISMERIEKFLNYQNTATHKRLSPLNNSSSTSNSSFIIDIKDANFGIKRYSTRNKTFKEKTLLHNITLQINKGEFVGVLGETGSGKSCIANAILGHFEHLNSHNKYNSYSYINGSISYASQLPFIINDTIKNNILFFNEENTERYQHVLAICQLTQDLETFPGRDFTEISSNGTNISGGQKARVSLARAVYNEAAIYLFDDPLSSVDSIIASNIFNKVLLDFLKDKTKIIIKHDLTNLERMDKIIYVEEGKIKWTGNYKEFIESHYHAKLEKSLQKNKDSDSKDGSKDEDDDKDMKDNTSSALSEVSHNESNRSLLSSKGRGNSSRDYVPQRQSKCLSKGKLIKDEEQRKGRIKMSSFMRFFKQMGNNSYFHVIFIILLSVAWQFFHIISNFWLTHWSNHKSSTTESKHDINLYHFLIYCQIAGLCLFFLFLKDFIISRSLLNVFRILHLNMITRIINAPINLFHDTTSIGQIINRLNFDIDRCKFIIRQYSLILKGLSILIGSVIICCNYNMYSLICLPFLFGFGVYITRFFINCGRDLSSIESISKAPIITCYNESINGIVSIRAYSKQNEFQNKFYKTLYEHLLVASYKFGVNNWYSLYLDICACVYLMFIVIFACVYREWFTPGMIGLMLKYSFSFCEQMCGVFEEMSNIEKAMVNYERCDAYMKIIQEKYDEQENNVYIKQKETKYQMETPSITFDSYSMRYRPNTDLIFDNVSIKINPYEKIGIVGRSGSGKSSLINALLRIVEPLSGRILISNQDTTSVPLKVLRQWFSIVPQDAFVFEGTLRDNLDPFHKHSDYELEQLLNELHFNDNMKMGSLSLDTKINEDGSIYSVGEKQLICFARAILQQRKIILFDEATANVDKKTQELMNKHIFTKFNNSTVIIIAHRLSNIMQCDKVIVMDKGEVIEYDKPQTLYMNNQSVFRQLCNNDKQMMI